MTTPADAVSEENQEPSGEESTNAPENEELDYQALYEKGQADLLKSNNDNKSLLGRIKEPALDPRMDEMLDTVDALRRSVNAVGVRTSSGETDELAGDLLKIDQSTATQKATNQYNRGYAKAETNLLDAFREKDEEGNVIPDGKIIAELTESPEVKELSDKWASAKAKDDLAAILDLVIDGLKIRSRFDRTAAATATDDAEEAQKAKDAKNGVHNLSLANPAAGGTKVKSRAQIEAITDIKDFSDEEYDSYIERFGAGKS